MATKEEAYRSAPRGKTCRQTSFITRNTPSLEQASQLPREYGSQQLYILGNTSNVKLNL